MLHVCAAVLVSGAMALGGPPDVTLSGADTLVVDENSLFESLLLTEHASASMSGGELSGSFEYPAHEITGGTVGVLDDARFSMSGGYIDGYVFVDDRAEASFEGTGEASDIRARASARVTMRGESYASEYRGLGSSMLTLDESAKVNTLALYDTALLTIEGGWVSELSVLWASRVEMTGGRLDYLHADFGGDRVVLSGGEIGRMVIGTAGVTLSGSTFRESDRPTVIPEIAMRFSGSLAIEARRFWIDGVPIDLDLGSELVLDATSSLIRPWDTFPQFDALNDVLIEYPDGRMTTFDVQFADTWNNSLGWGGTVMLRSVPGASVVSVVCCFGTISCCGQSRRR